MREPIPPRDALAEMPIMRLLAVAGHLVSRSWRQVVEVHGLSAAGLAVLFEIWQAGGAPHREIAQRCYVSPATLSGVVDTLERDGWVVRRRDPADRRRVLLDLTDSGSERLAEIRQTIGREYGDLADLDPEAERHVRKFLLDTIARLEA
jgi:MarR family transcriptional regulator, organic hydroperoxide resistance regulator